MTQACEAKGLTAYLPEIESWTVVRYFHDDASSIERGAHSLAYTTGMAIGIAESLLDKTVDADLARKRERRSLVGKRQLDLRSRELLMRVRCMRYELRGLDGLDMGKDQASAEAPDFTERIVET